MPKLLQINCTLNCGSTGRITEQIAESATNKGWDCYVAYGGRYLNPSKQKTIQVSNKLDNYLHAFQGVFLGRHGLGSYCFTHSFIERIKELRPDVIHLHNIHGYYIHYPLLFEYLRSSGIPVIWTLHDCWAITGHCTHFDSIGCQRWKTGCYDCPMKLHQYKTFYDRSKQNYLLKKKEFTSVENLTIVPVSEWLSSIVAESFLGKYPRRVISNGIDLGVFTAKEGSPTLRERMGIAPSKSIVLGVSSSWDDEKGLSEFNRIADDNRLTVIMIGIENKDRRRLNSSIVSIPRITSQEELSIYYSAADVFVNPTYNDSYPTVNMESLACGTPVVTYRTGGCPEMLSDDTGIVVERGDYSSLKNAINTIIARGKGHYRLACIERAHRLFDKDKKFSEYVALYDSVIKN